MDENLIEDAWNILPLKSKIKISLQAYYLDKHADELDYGAYADDSIEDQKKYKETVDKIRKEVNEVFDLITKVTEEHEIQRSVKLRQRKR